MSTSSAIATVTATLQHLLTQATSANLVTARPPAVARDPNNAVSQINVFLYRTEVNTAFSNFPMPGTSRANESGRPPLALTLRYLLTAYGEDDDDISGQQVIGESMLTLHDHAVLGRQTIEGLAPDSGLHRQLERVRITSDPISSDEMTRLWNTFQTGYRLSHAYEVSVTLIESERNGPTPLPVLRRGDNDEGVAVQAGIEPPFACLTGIEFEDANLDAAAGELVVFRGARLEAPAVEIEFAGRRGMAPISLAVAVIADASLTLQMPNALGGIPAGAYQVRAVLTDAGEVRRTNALAMSVAPQIGNLVVGGAANNRSLTLDIATAPAPGQDLVLLMGGRAFSDYVEVAPQTLRFDLGDIPPDDYLVRLRVDGVDSRFIDRTVTPPAFLPGIEVTIP